MDSSARGSPRSPSSSAPASSSPAQLAKAALRRLAMSKQEPTPENYARAYAEEAGDGGAAASVLPERARPLVERLAARAGGDDAGLRDELAQSLLQGRWDELQRALDRGGESGVAQSQAWAALIERIARGLERGGRQWTAARKKDSLQRVLDGSRSDMQRLQQRLKQLVGGWEGDTDPDAVEIEVAGTDEAAGTGTAPAAAPEAAAVPGAAPQADAAAPLWLPAAADLSATVQSALPIFEPRAAELGDELSALAAGLAEGGPTPERLQALASVCDRARRLFAHRHHLLDELGRLVYELTAGLTELAEDESWARGQAEAMQARLGDKNLSPRGVRAAGDLLAETRRRQGALRAEREAARDALKGLIQSLISELGELGGQTGRFHDSLGRYAEVIGNADSLESLAGVVREMVEESRAVQQVVGQAQQRLNAEHTRASELEGKVRQLEGELRRLSDEVSTDALTQVANRRGLMQIFEQHQAEMGREPAPLALGLLDIDNFKRLNDTLGHAAGDEALKALAERVGSSLRPRDAVARYGGEEFVVVMPATPVEEAQQALTRLQRTLSGSLFMHEQAPVFVTFSAGVTAYRSGETLEQALERADEALYEAKRTGKNRTCIA